jgi:hypothetical protein
MSISVLVLCLVTHCGLSGRHQRLDKKIHFSLEDGGRISLRNIDIYVHVQTSTMLQKRPGVAQSTSHSWGLGSVSGQSICDLWWTRWQWDRLLSEFFDFSRSVPLHCGSSYLSVNSWMDDRPVGGRSSETQYQQQKEVIFDHSFFTEFPPFSISLCSNPLNCIISSKFPTFFITFMLSNCVHPVCETAWSKLLIENLIVLNSPRNSPLFMEPPVSLPCSQEPYPKPD